ncbi:selenide,water dikinase [Aequitasia blattaphilus]
MSKLPKFENPDLLVGIETSDDAAIYKINDEIAMIQTLDFFTPIVDDPYMFGQIAAANSLSDVWAMGGEPKVALNIVAFPSCLDPEILGEILRGGADKVKEAGAVLVGGHTIQDDEPKYGLSVSGFVHPNKIYKNYGCQVGDVLILTKQIGSGIINTAIKADMASKEAIEETQRVMASLNMKAKRVIEKYEVHACTDITGFGLIGHCLEMAEASKVGFELNPAEIPFMREAARYSKMGLIPAGAYKNKGYSMGKVEFDKLEEHIVDLLCDPQTSGGLLFSVKQEDKDKILEELKNAELETTCKIIGEVTENRGKVITFI